jgi:hypothetical protein
MCQAGLESRCVWLSLTAGVSEFFRQRCVMCQAGLDSRSVRGSDSDVSCIRLGFTASVRDSESAVLCVRMGLTACVSETQTPLCYVLGWA